MQDLILKELVKKLEAPGGGSCEADPGCVHGFGVKKCSASRAIIEDKFAAIKAEALAETKASGINTWAGSGNFDADWPCLTCVTIQFVSPEREGAKPTDV